MLVQKFGGTSVGTPQRMKNVGQLVSDGNKKIVVLSAMSGTTNNLLKISDAYSKGQIAEAKRFISEMRSLYERHFKELFATDEYRFKMTQYAENVFSLLESMSEIEFGDKEERIVVAQGELLSSHMMTYYLSEIGERVTILSAFDYMCIKEDKEPDFSLISERLEAIIPSLTSNIIVTQGFIGINSKGEIDNLKRGGSDYTASLIGAAINAEEIQIWTDIDGMHNNDPRFVENTKAVRHLNFEEASELAYFGAKILHPTCILPALKKSIPVKLLNTMDPNALGTIIDNQKDLDTIKAIAAKDGITTIKIKSSKMLLAYGFIENVFHVFAKYRTPIDMICTSEVGVSVSIDNIEYIKEITDELSRYGTVTVDSDFCIICVVGNMEWHSVCFQNKILEAFENIPIRMISYGGSNYNVSFLIESKNKVDALKNLSEKCF